MRSRLDINRIDDVRRADVGTLPVPVLHKPAIDEALDLLTTLTTELTYGKWTNEKADKCLRLAIEAKAQAKDARDEIIRLRPPG